MATPPPPPPLSARPHVAVFYRTPAELVQVSVDRITSITVVAPSRITHDAIWTVRIGMGADNIERLFAVDEYVDEAHGNAVRAFALARDDAVVFARELGAHVAQLKKGGQ